MTIIRLIENAYNRNLIKTSFELFKKLFSFDLRLKKKFWDSDNSFVYQHNFLADYYDAVFAWEMIGDTVVREYSNVVMLFVKETVERLHNAYEVAGQASVNLEPLSMILSISEEQGHQHESSLGLLDQIFFDSCSVEKCTDSEQKKVILKSCLMSESNLLQNIALRGLRKTDLFSCSEKLMLLLSKTFLHSVWAEDRVFLLIDEIFHELSQKEKDILIDQVVNPVISEDEKLNKYFINKWCQRLLKIDPENSRIRNICKENNLNQTVHMDIEEQFADDMAVWIEEQSPITDAEMLQMEIEKVVNILVNFETDKKEIIFTRTPITREGLLEAFSRCVCSNYLWAVQITNCLIRKSIVLEDIWVRLLYGICESEAPADQLIEVVRNISDYIEFIPYKRGLADFLYYIIRKDDIKLSFLKYEKELYDFSEKIWLYRDKGEAQSNNILHESLNTTQGLVILSWINMVSYCEDLVIPEKYKKHFEEALLLESWEQNIAICILIGHFNFFYYRDKSWSERNFLTILKGDDQQLFQCAWEGVVYFSGRINKNISDIIAPIYFSAVKHVSWLNEKVSRRFIELYLTLLIDVIEKPTLKYIPEFYKASRSQEIVFFISAIKHRLTKMNSSDKKEWWNAWLSRFLENRKNNKPIQLNDDENSALLELLPELEEVFENAVLILTKGKMPQQVNHMFWYSLKKKDLGKKYPHSMSLLMTKLFTSRIAQDYDKSNILGIVKSMQGLTENEKDLLQEALLKQGIDI